MKKEMEVKRNKCGLHLRKAAILVVSLEDET